MNGRSPLAGRLSILVALIAVLGLTFTVVSGDAVASSGQATIAKKTCKKGKKSAVAAKKKCKKKTAPAPAPTSPSPTVRATLTWNSAADLDLIVWAPDGTLGFVYSSGNAIPSSQFSADDIDGNGPESFTDTAFVPGGSSNRQFTYGVCVADDDGLDGTIATIQYKRADGTSGSITTDNGDLDDPGDGDFVAPSGGYVPTTSPC